MANLTTNQGTFSNEVRTQWQEWLDGSIPSAEPPPTDTSVKKSGPGIRLKLK
jgi:hypothetical protein